MGKVTNEKEKNTTTIVDEQKNNGITFSPELDGFNLSIYPSAKDMKKKTNEYNDSVFKQIFSIIESASIRGLYETKIQLRTNISVTTVTSVLRTLGYTIRDAGSNGTYIEFNISWNKV